MTTRLFVASLLACAAFAQDPDPPSRVARLNWLNGNVSFRPAGVEDWTAATPNYPLTTGDHIYTDTGSQAEMHVGPNAIRLNGQTNFGFLNLDDQTVQVRFTEGSMELRLRVLEDQDIYEVDTPQGAISLLRTGDYRIDTDPSRNATMITVWSGDVQVSANGRSFAVHPRQTAYFADGGDPDIRAANPPDDFDTFAGSRNREEDNVPPPVYVSQSMAGYEDLNANGSWSDAPEYGPVWTPRVAAGWAPYHDGHWAWVEPWGWTWIDDAPWGFAPFHYGRWAYYRGGWVWAPGAVVARPVYAPALVAFVGGASFGVSVGWFPLGPREPFYPAYHVSPVYVQRVNVTHVNVTNINVTNIHYVNQNVNGGVTVVSREAFVGARPVRTAIVRVNQDQIARAQVVGAAPRIAPRRESVMGPQPVRAVAVPPRAIDARQVVVRKAAPPPAVSFAARQQMLDANQGSPLAPAQVRELRQRQPQAVIDRAPVRPAGAPAAPAPAAPANSGVPRRQFGRPPDRMDSRPTDARPMPAPAAQEPVVRPEVNRPAQPASPAAPPEPQRPQFNRPAPAPAAAPPPERPRPPLVRPAPENRPAPPAREGRQEQPRRENRQQRDDNKAKDK